MLRFFSGRSDFRRVSVGRLFKAAPASSSGLHSSLFVQGQSSIRSSAPGSNHRFQPTVCASRPLLVTSPCARAHTAAEPERWAASAVGTMVRACIKKYGWELC
jgi:hypothetical protein